MSVSQVCDLDATMRAAVQEKYTRMARRGRFHFHYPSGRAGLAGLDYGPAELIDGLPGACAMGFCGVGNALGLGDIALGERVCDAGCGTGTEALLAAGRVGPAGRVVGFDLVPAVLELARQGCRRAGLGNVDFVLADVLEVPLAGGGFDVVVSNGVFHMIADKERALAEVFRLLRPGGRFQVADLTLLAGSDGWCRPNEATFFQ